MVKNRSLDDFCRDSFEKLYSNLIPEDDYPLQLVDINEHFLLIPKRQLAKDEKGYNSVLFKEVEEYEYFLRHLQKNFYWLSDSWVIDTIEHEKEHIEEAKQICVGGNKIIYFYGVTLLQMNNGNIVVQPFLQLYDDALTYEQKVRILKKPKNLSHRDRIELNSLYYSQ